MIFKIGIHLYFIANGVRWVLPCMRAARKCSVAIFLYCLHLSKNLHNYIPEQEASLRVNRLSVACFSLFPWWIFFLFSLLSSFPLLPWIYYFLSSYSSLHPFHYTAPFPRVHLRFYWFSLFFSFSASSSSSSYFSFPFYSHYNSIIFPFPTFPFS